MNSPSKASLGVATNSPKGVFTVLPHSTVAVKSESCMVGPYLTSEMVPPLLLSMVSLKLAGTVNSVRKLMVKGRWL